MQVTRGVWRAEHTQIERGELAGRTEFVATPRMTAYREAGTRSLFIRADLPPGRIAFAVPDDHPQPFRVWGDDPVAAGEVTFVTSAGELSVRTEPGYAATVLVFDMGFLEDVARIHRTELRLSDLPPEGFLHAVPGDPSSSLRAIADGLLRCAGTEPESLSRQWSSVRLLEEELADSLLNALAPRGRNPRPMVPGTATRRARLVRECLAHAEGLGFEVSVPQLCETFAVGRRTLEYAFREHTGTSPGRFLRLRRLALAHSALTVSRQGQSSVSTVAVRWGFTHLGRFATEYRRLFGEVPSATLRSPRTPTPSIG